MRPSFALSAAPMLLGALQAVTVGAIQTISAVGSKFFYENGTQYYIKGIAYQLTSQDPLIDTAQCKRDISRMAELGTNAIRVYHVDATANHKGCMSAFADAGIYLFVDLDTFNSQIEQTDPHWNKTQFDKFKQVLDEFQQFDNTAGVFVGNEVVTTTEGAHAAPYVLAAARDIKAYRDQKGYRQIPVGYSAADIAYLRPMLQNYLACSSNASERLDFYSLNAYEWCGQSSYTLSGYNMLEKNATGYPIPIFFSETGCNVPEPRTFQDQSAIFGPEMADTWSGAIIYEWIEETNNYGLVSYGPSVNVPTATNPIIQEGYTREGTPTPISPDFQNLQSQWATLNPTGVSLAEYRQSASTITGMACPSSTPNGWPVNPNSPLPTLGQTYQKSATTANQTGTGASGAGAASGSASGSAASASATKKSAAHAVAVTGIVATERLLMVSILLSGVVGAVAFWL